MSLASTPDTSSKVQVLLLEEATDELRKPSSPGTSGVMGFKKPGPKKKNKSQNKNNTKNDGKDQTKEAFLEVLPASDENGSDKALNARTGLGIGSIMGHTSKKNFVIDPDDRWKICWDWVIIVIVIYNVVFIPYNMGFLAPGDPMSTVLDILFNLMLWFDIGMNFKTGYRDRMGFLVSDPVKIRKRYVRTRFKWDFLGSVFFVLELLQMMCKCINIFPYLSEDRGGFLDDRQMHELALNLLSMPGLFRIARIVVNDRMSTSFFNVLWIKLLRLLFYYFIFAHIFGCMFYCVSWIQPKEYYPDSWIVIEGIEHPWDVPRDQMLQRWDHYIHCLYWSIVTMSSVGYGDINPATVAERIFVIPFLLLSTFAYAAIVGNVTFVVESITASSRRYQRKLDMLTEFIGVNEVEGSLATNLKRYTDELWLSAKGDDVNDILYKMPDSIQREVMISLYGDAMSKMALFQDCSREFLESVVCKLRPQIYLEKSFIIKQGDHAREMYLLTSGYCEVIIHNDTSDDRVDYRELNIIGEVKESDFFGEIGLLLNEPRTASVRTVERCDVMCISSEDFDEALRNFPEYKSALIKHARSRLEDDLKVTDRVVKVVTVKKNAKRQLHQLRSAVIKTQLKDQTTKAFMRPAGETDEAVFSRQRFQAQRLVTTLDGLDRSKAFKPPRKS